MKNKISSLILIVALFSAIALVGCSSEAKAEDGIQEYVSSLYPGWTVEGSSIIPYDTDQDGYVSADVRIKGPNGEEKMLALSCAKVGSFNSGCKARVGGISQQ